MIVLNAVEMQELVDSRRLTLKVEVQGYDVFELVTEGFYKDMYRVHGPSLYDVPEIDDNDNVIDVKKVGTYERSCVRPQHIDKFCPFTKGQSTVDVYNTDGTPTFSVLSNVKVLHENNKYYWVITLILV
jgi:hypothetical protein